MRIDADCRTFLRTVARNYENEALCEAFEKCETVGAAVLAFTEMTMVDAKPEFVENGSPIATFLANLSIFGHIAPGSLKAINYDKPLNIGYSVKFATMLGEVARCAEASIACGDSNRYDTDLHDQMVAAFHLIEPAVEKALIGERLTAALVLSTVLGDDEVDTLLESEPEFKGGSSVLGVLALQALPELDRDEVELMCDEHLKARLAKRNQSTPAT